MNMQKEVKLAFAQEGREDGRASTRQDRIHTSRRKFSIVISYPRCTGAVKIPPKLQRQMREKGAL